MKGVVRPQAMPTRRKPSVERKMEGGEASIGWEKENGGWFDGGLTVFYLILRIWLA